MTGTYEFELIPESGTLPPDRESRTWERIKYPLLEFQPAKRVERRTIPDRIHVIAYGSPGDAVPPAILQRIEELCGTRLFQIAPGGVTTEQFVAAVVDAVPEVRKVVDEHLADNEELLIHLLLPSMLAQAAEWFAGGDREPAHRLLLAVDRGLRLGDWPLVNAILVSFVEHVGAFPGETPDFIAAWPARLISEYRHLS